MSMSSLMSFALLHSAGGLPLGAISGPFGYVFGSISADLTPKR